MDLKFSVGDPVAVAGVSTDTGMTMDGLAIKSLIPAGKVIEAREFPPNNETDTWSPHYRVALMDSDGGKHDAWFVEARLF